MPWSVDYYKTLRRIRLVSAEWSEIIRDDPSFWSPLYCTDSIEQAEFSLEHSQALPLHVGFFCRDLILPDDAPKARKRGKYKPQTHDHSHFIQVLLEHTPPRAIRQLYIQPHEKDLEDFEEILTRPSPLLLALEINPQAENEYDYKENKLDLEDMHLLGGVATSLGTLTLAYCVVPSQFPPLPSLDSLALHASTLNDTDVFNIITGHPSLRTLSVTRCSGWHGLGKQSAPTAVHSTRIQHLLVEGNKGMEISSVIDYLDAPEVESFHVGCGEETRMQFLSRWVKNFSKRNQASNMNMHIKLPRGAHTGESLVVIIRLGPNFSFSVITSQYGGSTWLPAGVVSLARLSDGSRDETNTSLTAGDEPVELIHNLHESACPELTYLEVDIAPFRLTQVLTDLSVHFTAVLEIFLSSDPRELLKFLGQPGESGDWPFSQLKVLRFREQTAPYDSSSAICNLLSARRLQGENGPTPLEKVHIMRGAVKQSFLGVAQELGVAVEMDSNVKMF